MAGSESFFVALKSKRESQDIEISEICEFTRIHSRYIEAIEKGDFTVLPNVYIRLFLKSYAKFIGADSAKALKDYELHTTGKITLSEELTKNEADITPSSLPTVETKMESNTQISPKQIASGIGVIFAIILLLWWASRVTQEQTENIKSNKLRVKVAEESLIDAANEEPKPESNLPELGSQSITNQAKNTETIVLTDKFPLNDNDFLFEKIDSEISHKVKLYPPYILSITTLQETKLNISKTENTIITELINQVVLGGQKFIFNFTSTINFEFWSSSQVNVKLNETSIDKYLINDDRLIRGSYEADKSKLYLSFYNR